MIDAQKLTENHDSLLKAGGFSNSAPNAVRGTTHTDGLPAIECRTWDAVVRAVGHFKYRHSADVLLRGQVCPTQTMKPSLYRNVPPGVDLDRMMDDFRSFYTKKVKKETAVQAASTEALVQHYGIRTRWLDVVDSIPHALFFAAHEYVRSPFNETMQSYVPAVCEFGYLYLLETDIGDPWRDETSGEAAPGLWWTKRRSMVCDLRQAKPSKALRPHAQHGLLLRPPKGNDNLDDHVVARIAVPTREARSWIGGGAAITREGLFPAPDWDTVYGRLLVDKTTNALSEFRRDHATNGGALIGSITRFDFVDYTTFNGSQQQ